MPGRPILPVLLKYRHKHFNVGWGITNNYWHLYRLLCQFINHLEVHTVQLALSSALRWRSPHVNLLPAGIACTL